MPASPPILLKSLAMNNHTRKFLICYDICDKKRLRKVHKAIRDCGIPIQFSVFLVELKPEELMALIETLKKFINVSAVPVFFGFVGGKKVDMIIGPDVAKIQNMCEGMSTI